MAIRLACQRGGTVAIGMGTEPYMWRSCVVKGMLRGRRTVEEDGRLALLCESLARRATA